MAKKIKAVLFDVDGTILDTMDYLLDAYNHALKLHLNKKVTWKDIAPLMGLPLIECYQKITQIEEVGVFADAHHEFQYNNLHLAVPYPNSIRTLKTLKKSGLAVAAVTTRFGDQVRGTLRLAKVEDFFDVVITPKEVVETKPHPAPLLKALEQLGNIKPKEAIMVGDAPVDILAGKNAGTKTIAARYGFFGEGIADTNPDYIVDDISEIIPIILK